MRLQRHLATVALAASAALLLAGSASAHAHLVKSTPAANAAVAAPKSISLTFNEKLTPAFSKFELTMPAMKGMDVPMKTVVSKDHLSIVGTPKSALAPGAYTVSWHAASADDGHKVDGTFNFTVK
jgi:methionine-rich copper-binding protein CopC